MAINRVEYPIDLDEMIAVCRSTAIEIEARESERGAIGGTQAEVLWAVALKLETLRDK